MPVAVFLHGGAWMRGDKHHILHLYENVGVACADMQCMSVVMNYCLHLVVGDCLGCGCDSAIMCDTDLIC